MRICNFGSDGCNIAVLISDEPLVSAVLVAPERVLSVPAGEGEAGWVLGSTPGVRSTSALALAKGITIKSLYL